MAPARPQGVELASVAVRPHPQVEGALRIDAVLGNPADTAAAYPRLILSFTSRQGEMRARRTFTPAEYLHGNQPLRIPPRSEMQVSLAIADPGRDAVNYLLQLDSSLSIID